jgi:TRAP-type uncharacterized transport system substrate-binding protein
MVFSRSAETLSEKQKRKFPTLRIPMRFVRVSWNDLVMTLIPILLIIAVGVGAALYFARPAPPDTIIITAGAPGSSYHGTAEKYRDILKRNGIKVQILDSDGALENLQRLKDIDFTVDVGFVQGGLLGDADPGELVSLGTINSSPLFVFSRCKTKVDQLSSLTGKRIAIGPDGSGTRVLALQLLKANGIEPPTTPMLDLGGEDAINAMRNDKADAVFLMGDSAKMSLVRDLLKVPGICLVSFDQADAYVRRFPYLTKLVLPMGAMDFGKNIPAQDVVLIGPTTELIAREELHPALSDVLIEAARQVHGRPGLFRHAGEFPAPIEHEYPISDDAERYYKSGKRFLYRQLPFWLASLTDRLLVLIVPILALLIPATRLVPPLYRWRVRSRIYRWYGALMSLEREMMNEPTAEKRAELNQRLDEIEQGVNRIKVPLSFADQAYVLRVHIGFVRQRLDALQRATPAAV